LTPQEQIRRVGEIVASLNRDEIRALGIAALRRWFASEPDHSCFSVHGHFGVYMAVMLVEKTGETGIHHHFGKEAFLQDQHKPWMAQVFEFLWWLIRAGFAMPLRIATDKSSDQELVQLRPTEAGIRLFESTDDHPVLPGFLDRVRTRCAGIPGEVLVHLADAQQCLDHALGRPSVVLTGLAYEVAIESIVERLVKKGRLSHQAQTFNAARRIGEVKAQLPALYPGTSMAQKQARFSAIAAWDFADVLRDRRNDGAHPGGGYDFSDLSESHELLLSAGRRLPALWATRRR
jgi:hypothetical protein